MGNYSRDPVARAADAAAKQYYAVRMQQGVPVLDADWNILDDIRRGEQEAVGRFVLGNGVPAGSDAFRIVALENGGMDTLVLSSNVAMGFSAVTVNLIASTAADALGFTTRNARAERSGDSPAQLTGFRAGPFVLSAGMTLVVSAENSPDETVTFNAADFADLAAATTAEVVDVLLVQLTRVTASAGTGNDFIIRGPSRDTGAPGRIFVDGQLVLIDADVTYTAQPLYENAALAASWGVTAVEPMPATATRIVVFIDMWGREVASVEDPELVDSRIGIETAIRVKRQWAVRTASELDFNAATVPPGHAYYPLAMVSRGAADTAVRASMLEDVRDTDLALRRDVAFYAGDGTLLVETAMFRDVLALTRGNVRDFIDFLTETFLPPTTTYFAGEVGGISVLNAVAGLAEQGLTVLDARAMDTRGAFALLAQLREVEQRVVDVWRTAVLPLERPAGIRVYENAFLTNINAIEALLSGPAPAGFTALVAALEARDLLAAVRTQERIAGEFGAPGSQATGSLVLTYLGSPAATIVRNVPFDMEFELTGSVTPDDDIEVIVFIDAGWQTTVRNDDGSTPVELRFGPGADAAEFIVTVRPPDVTVAQTNIAVRVNASSNPGGLTTMTGQMLLRIGDPPPGSAEDFMISVLMSNVPEVGGVFEVPVALPAANFNFSIINSTDTAANVDLSFEPLAAPGWTIVPPMGWPATGTNVPVPAEGSISRLFQFGPPAVAGNDLTFVLRAREAGGVEVLAEIQIALTTV